MDKKKILESMGEGMALNGILECKNRKE